MPLSFSKHLRAILRAAFPAAAFLTGWSLRPDAPAIAPAAHRTISADDQNRGAAAERKAGAPGQTEAAGASAEVSRSGPAGRIAALLDKAALLDAPDTLAALKALDLQPGADGALARQIYLARFGELDPETALTYIDTLPATERAASAATVMSAWAARDPQAAAAHLAGEADGFGLSGDAAAQASGAVAAAWAASDPAAASAWAQGLEDESLRAAALPALAASLTTQNVATATAWVSRLPPDDQRTAAGAVASQWAQSQPQQAAAWALSLHVDAAATAAEGVVSAWMLADPPAASQWVKNLPAGETRDAAILALTDSPAIRNDAASAAAWAGVIQNAELRTSALATAVERWRYQQPEFFAEMDAP